MVCTLTFYIDITKLRSEGGLISRGTSQTRQDPRRTYQVERTVEQGGHHHGAAQLPPLGGLGTDAPGDSHCRCHRDGLGSSLDISHPVYTRARQAWLKTVNSILLLKGLTNMPTRPLLRRE